MMSDPGLLPIVDYTGGSTRKECLFQAHSILKGREIFIGKYMKGSQNLLKSGRDKVKYMKGCQILGEMSMQNT